MSEIISQPRNAEEYFENKTREKDVDFEAAEELSKDIFEIEYDENGGEVNLEFGEYRFHLEYSPVQNNLLQDLYRRRIPEADTAEVFRVNSLVLSDKKNEKFVFDLSKILPHDIPVLFSTQNIGWEKACMVTCEVGEESVDDEGIRKIQNPEELSFIPLGFHFSNRISFLILAHEIGHVYDEVDQKMSERKNKPRFDKSAGSWQTKRSAEKLLKERNAWAFAIKALKSFIGSKKNGDEGRKFFPRKEVIAFVEKHCLWTYKMKALSDVSLEKTLINFYRSEMDYWLDQTNEFTDDGIYESQMGEFDSLLEEDIENLEKKEQEQK